jgi:hypothetical protein
VDAKQLAEGEWRPDRMRALALSSLVPEQLSVRTGMVFFESWDNLGDMLVSMIQLNSGARCFLYHHAVGPVRGTGVMTDREDDLDAVVDEFLDSTGLSAADLSWTISDGFPPSADGRD